MTIPAQLIETIVERLDRNMRIRRTLPERGRIAIDRQLPFLVVYRRPTGSEDPGTDRLVTGSAAYLICSGSDDAYESTSELVQTIACSMIDHFGSFLALELWVGKPAANDEPLTMEELTPGFRIFAQKGSSDDAITHQLTEALGRLKLGSQRAVVRAKTTGRCGPKGMPPIVSPDLISNRECYLYGVEVAPVYRDPDTGELFPQVLRLLRGRVNVALRRALFEFATTHTTHRPAHYHALGQRAVVKAVWEADEQLAEVSEQFDFLLQVTPVNGEQAWHEFERGRFQYSPAFHYRPLGIDPIVLKRALYRAPVERIEDPALGRIFRGKLVDLDRRITMLQERNTPRFLKECEQLYGEVEDDLHDQALKILEIIPPRSRETGRGHVDAAGFAERARQEIAYFRKQLPGLDSRVELRSDVTGLMVSRGNLLVSTRSMIPTSRVEALIQHEVGTHLLTYHNGRAQRLRQLYLGLAGYDTLQEGLAVLAEYLVGGLSRPRLRLLALRVVAARCLVEDATFVDTFRALTREHGASRRNAFIVTMRTYRSGGFTKDAVYLKGLEQILKYIPRAGTIEPLLVGKIGIRHIPVVRELQWRKVLTEPPLTPRYMTNPEALKRLEKLREGVSVIDLIRRGRS